MAVPPDLNSQPDTRLHTVILDPLLAAPVSAPAGVSDSDADHLAAGLNIKTVADPETINAFRPRRGAVRGVRVTSPAGLGRHRRTAMLPVLLAVLLLMAACNNKAAPTTVTAPVSQPTGTVASGAGAPAASSPTDPNACPTANTTPFAKTKLVLHAGLAFGAFHRYLYKPYRAGTFTSGSTLHRTLVIGKAGASALFIKREIRLAVEDVKANPTLCNAIAAPLRSLEATVGDAITKLKRGDTSGLERANTAVAAIQSQAKTAGLSLPEDTNATIG